MKKSIYTAMKASVESTLSDIPNELIWLISYEEHGENSGMLPDPYMPFVAK